MFLVLNWAAQIGSMVGTVVDQDLAEARHHEFVMAADERHPHPSLL